MTKGLTVEQMRGKIRASIGPGKRFESAADFARKANYTPAYVSILLKYGTISNGVAEHFGYEFPREKLYYPIEGEEDEEIQGYGA